MNEPSASSGEPIDRHRIDTPFAHTRVHRPESVRRLIASLEAVGQQVPLILVERGERLVLVDGYRRWDALGRLGRDIVQGVVWQCGLAEALAQVLARHQARPFEPIEQAWLLMAMQAEGMSQRAMAECVGKDPSWVNRRLALLAALSEPVQEAVREGVISTWAASRVLVPLARANAADAEALLAHLRIEPLSTRALAIWLEQYRQSNSTGRARLLAHPHLLIRSLEAGADDPPSDPEGQWLAELERVRRHILRLRRTLAALLEPSPTPQTWQALRTAVAKTTQALEHLRQPLQEDCDADRAAATDHHRAASEGAGHPSDQPHPGPRPPHGPQGAQRGQQPAATADDDRCAARAQLAAARAVLHGSGDCGADPGAAP
jgi:ParB/RepB/Spo0J family partition protein